MADFNQQKEKENTVVINVRSNTERACFNIGVLHIPLNELEQKLSSLDNQHKYLLYCQSGVRSLKAAQLLIDHGFSEVSSMHHGLLGC